MILVSREPRPPPKSLSDVPRFQGSWCSQLSSEHKVVTGTRKSSQQETTANQMIRLHELMAKSTRKLQDGVVGYTQVTGT